MEFLWMSEADSRSKRILCDVLEMSTVSCGNPASALTATRAFNVVDRCANLFSMDTDI